MKQRDNYDILWVGAWPSGQRVGSAIRRIRVQVPLRSLAGFVQSLLFRIQILYHAC